jgi:hypothetical protein
VTEPAFFIFAFATGAIGMGGIATEVPEQQFDAFSFDLDNGRTERHTNGTPVDEFPFAF